MTNRQQMGLFWKHAKRDLMRHKCHYSLAFCSVFIVVLASLVVTSIVNKGPIIFLKRAQNQHGEVDAYITPARVTDVTPYNQGIFLNFTQAEIVTKSQYNISPRKVFWGVGIDVYNHRSQLAYQNKFLADQPFLATDYASQMSLPTREDLYKAPPTNQWSCLYLTNTRKERKYGIGHNYTLDPLGIGQCNLNQAFQKTIGAEVGDIVYFEVLMDGLLRLLIRDYNQYA